MGFCKEYNAATQDKLGEVVPVELTVYEVDIRLALLQHMAYFDVFT